MALRGCLTERNLTQFQLWAEHKEYSRYYAGFDHFYSAYHPIHGPLSTALASIGVLMNLANIVVLTRPSLINVVNVILTAMSLCDIGLDLSYLLYLAHFVLSKADYHRDFYCDPSQNTWGWAVFQLFHAHFSTISHATTLWLAVGMAGMRHFILSRPHPVANTSTRLLPGLLVIFLTAALVVLSSVPHLLLYRISPVPYELSGCPDLESENETAWRATVQRYIESKTVVWGVEMWENRCAVRIFSFWISGLCYKILPCAMLSVFMGLLISTVLKVMSML